MVFIFQFVNVEYHIDLFVNIEESLHPWDKARLIMMLPSDLLLKRTILEAVWKIKWKD